MSTRSEFHQTRQHQARSNVSAEKPFRTSWTSGRSWSGEEIEDLLNRASTQTIPTIANQLGRSEMAVRHKLRSLGVDFQDLAGFKGKDLATMLQVTLRQIRRWRRKGYLKSVNGRITEESFIQFCKEHAAKIPYDGLDDSIQLWLRSYGYCPQKPLAGC